MSCKSDLRNMREHTVVQRIVYVVYVVHDQSIQQMLRLTLSLFHYLFFISFKFALFQVEGGFVQGLGLFTLEEVRFSQSGSLWTMGPGAYKIPGFADIPVEFYVHLLRSAPNEKAVYSSKV